MSGLGFRRGPALGGQVGLGNLRANQEGRHTVTQMGKTHWDFQEELPAEVSKLGAFILGSVCGDSMA